MKKAFILGANYTDLKFAETDATKFADALEKQDYKVSRYIASDKKSNEVMNDFKKFVKSEEDDTLLFYFAGHGITEDNTLSLALNNSDPKNVETFIDIEQITFYLKPRYCKATKILIIIDSCKSGKINEIANIKNSENYYIITAAEDWQKTPELTDLDDGAGFLSHFITKAINGDTYIGETITPQTLTSWLIQKKDDYNLAKGKNIVPTITLLGKQQVEFEIVKIKNSLKQVVEKLEEKKRKLDKEFSELLKKSRDRKYTIEERDEFRHVS